MNARPLTGLTCLLVLQVMGEVMSRAFDLPFPGPVTGMILLLVVLRWQPVQHVVSTAAPGLLSHLSLLFVPVGVGVISHLSVVSDFGWQIGLIIVLSTWAGMLATLAVLRFGRALDGDDRHGNNRNEMNRSVNHSSVNKSSVNHSSVNHISVNHSSEAEHA